MHLPELNPFKLLKKLWQRWTLALVVIYLFLEDSQREHKSERAFLVTLLIYAALFVLAELTRPKPKEEDARPGPRFSFPTSTEGRKVPLLFGTDLVDGPNVTWYGDLLVDPVRKEQKTGFFSSVTTTVGEHYHVGIQFGLCRGPGVVLKRVLIGEEEVFSGTVAGESRFDIDDPNLFGGDDFGNGDAGGGIQATCDFYGGTTTQVVNAYLDDDSRQRISTAATPTCPRYTGESYVVARQLTSAAPLASNRGAYIGNTTSVAAWAFEVQRFPALFGAQSGGDNIINTDDCNPMNVIYEVLTDDEWGFGGSAADVNLVNFKLAADRLIAEGNGFSMLIDTEMKAIDFLKEIQRQIDGVLFLNQRTGQWTMQLARGADDPSFGYDIDTVAQFTDDTISELTDFTHGSWQDTTNQITVKYRKRVDDYKENFAPAQDMANALIQGGGTVITTLAVAADATYPGVRTGALAAILAWRDLRFQSYPLARATFIVDRQFWDLIVGSVIAWTNTKNGFVKLPMRVTSIDYGKLTDNKMKVTTVQDVFEFAAASYGAPPATGWTLPTVTLVAFPSAEQTAYEAPRALLLRDPDGNGDDTSSKVHAAARRQSAESAVRITQRNAAGAPAGAYANAGSILGLVRIGQLKNTLAAGTAVPTVTITLTATPDAQSDLESIFDDATTVEDMGVDLAQLVMVGTEFMLVQSASESGADVDLENVYRGVLDSAQQTHASGTDVFLLFAGAGMSSTVFANTNNVDIELRGRSTRAEFVGAVTTIALTMDKRAMRPYLPAEVSIDASRYPTPSLEGSGAGLDGLRNDYTWLKRDFTASNEIAALSDDAPAIDASTEYQVELRADPASADNLISTGAWVADSSPAIQVLRKLMLHYAPSGDANNEFRVIIRARHDYKTETNLGSRQTLIYDFTPTSALTSQFALGSLAATTASAIYTAAATGTFTVNIGTAFSTSDVESQVNGGGWSVVIASSGSTGTIVGVNSSDTIELRHTVNDSGARTFVELQDPSLVSVAYGVLHAGQAAV